MKNKKVYAVIESFSSKEINRCKKFIISPYFNKNEGIIDLFNLLVSEVKREHYGDISDEKIWTLLEPNKPYNSVRLRKYFSDLLKLIERFIAQEEYEAKPIQKATLLLHGISSRKLENLHSSSIRTATKLSSEQKKESIDGYFYNYQIEKLINDLKSGNDVFEELNLDTISMNLDTYYLIEKLRLYCKLLNVKFQKNTEEDILLMAPLINHIENHDYAQIPQLNIYYQIFNSMRDRENTAHYFKLKKLLKEYGGRFDTLEASEMYNFAINYTVLKINSGNKSFLDEYFTLYEDLLNKRVIFEYNELPPKHFYNVTTIALRLKKYDWVSNFIENYNGFINIKERENAVTFTTAQLNFYKKDFNKVLELLRYVEYPDMWRKLNSKVILIKTYVELNEVEPLFSLLDSFRTFLRRNSQISKEVWVEYLNMIKFVRRFISIHPRETTKLKALLEKVESTERLTNKSWLIEKINSSLNN
jgi:hypothetical protein